MAVQQAPHPEIDDVLRTEDMVVNIGPQHPSTHGVLRLITTLQGEMVRDMEPVIGYLHRSKEKMAESRTYLYLQEANDTIVNQLPLGSVVRPSDNRLSIDLESACSSAGGDRTVTSIYKFTFTRK